MSCESSRNRMQFPLLPFYNASPAVFNYNDRSVSLLPCPRLKNEFNITQDTHSQNYQILKSESSAVQCSFLVNRHSASTESIITQWPYPLANQLYENRPNIAQNPNLVPHQIYANETSIVKVFHPPTNRMPVNNLNASVYLQNRQLSSERTHLNQDFLPVTHQLSAKETSIVKAFHPPIYRMPVNNSNASVYLQNHQLSSERATLNRNFPPVTRQLSANESSISQLPFSSSHQLPTNATFMSLNSNTFHHKLSISKSQIKYPQKYFGRNQVKYPLDRQQFERESIMHQGLQSISGLHSENKFGVRQNRYIPSHQSDALNQGSYPSTINPPEMVFDRHLEPLVFGTSLHKNLYPQYFEKVHVYVVGPPRCGKSDLMRIFARNDDIRISDDKPLCWVAQQRMVDFGITLKIDAWYGENLISAVEDIKSLCQSSKSVLFLLYSVAQKGTLLTVQKWIEFSKKDIGFKVPIILIGNVTDVEFSCASRKFPKKVPNIVRFKDGAKVKDKYGLAAFYECSTKSVKDVDAIFLTAALKAFHHTQKSDQK